MLQCDRNEINMVRLNGGMRKIKCVIFIVRLFLFPLLLLLEAFLSGFVSFALFLVSLADDLLNLFPCGGLSFNGFDFCDRLLC